MFFLSQTTFIPVSFLRLVVPIKTLNNSTPDADDGDSMRVVRIGV